MSNAQSPSQSKIEAKIGDNATNVSIGKDIAQNIQTDTVNFYLYSNTETAKIIIRIEGDYNAFSLKDRETLSRIISEALSMEEPVKIFRVDPGSILVTLELPSNKAIELYTMVTNGLLAKDGIIRVEKISLVRADLRGADLRGADLRRADLRRADLSDSNLSGANLQGTNLIEANLLRADLNRTDLYRASLFLANLSGANLSGADLRRADLRRADLSGSILENAIYNEKTQWPKDFEYTESGAIRQPKRGHPKQGRPTLGGLKWRPTKQGQPIRGQPARNQPKRNQPKQAPTKQGRPKQS